MKRTFLATLMAAFAVGCGSESVEPTSDSLPADPVISIPDVAETDGGQTPDATAGSKTTLVSLKVPGMT